jgi:hypothetical protein
MMMLRMERRSAAVVSVTLLGAACVGGHGVHPTGRAGQPASPAAAFPAIDVPPLPPQGVVVQERTAVTLVALDGLVIVHLPGFELANPSDPPGVVLLVKDGQTYLLRVGASGLLPVTTARAEQFTVADDPELDLPLPHGAVVIDGDLAGHWRWARFSPDATWVLAQWSGECEIPTAFMVRSDARVPMPVTGEWGLRHAPESIALGWTAGGEAVVDLPVGSCGASAKRSGVYLISAPGSLALIYPHVRGTLVRMWGTA